ncbi:MAG: ATP phosphoribosyltransferase regulatory subunit [Synergistaceae bacterium]|nr:ATP phosphoribosyltransferase regulatory subunit [Synergistaceae bacterium]
MLNLKLRPEERAALNLRSLYEAQGYHFYRMSRFEEYDFYADKKDFLTSKSILTFTDINGKLMALRPDVTLSIVKHIKNSDGVQKFYYDEKVYRVPKNADSFREISQAGVECVGVLSNENIREVLELALKSLETIADGRNFVLDIANASTIAQLLENNEIKSEKSEILKCIAAKNIHGLKAINAPEKLINLLESNEIDDNTEKIINSIQNYRDKIKIDYSAVSNLNYYNGLVFRGFIEGVPESILSGGQYDGLMKLMGKKNLRAIGFAVYLDLIRGEKND